MAEMIKPDPTANFLCLCVTLILSIANTSAFGGSLTTHAFPIRRGKRSSTAGILANQIRSQLPRCRFYERGCQEKYLTADRPTGRKPIVAASPVSVETNDFNQLCGHSAPHHNVMSSSETEKRCGG